MIAKSRVGQNLEGQKAEIEKWIRGNVANPDEVVWFEDKAAGTNTSRPGFQALQKAIFNGEVKTVVVFKLDRVSRSLRDGVNVIHDWIEKGVRLVAVTQQIHLNGAAGRMMAAVILAVAEMENETRKERQAAGIAVAKERGVY